MRFSGKDIRLKILSVKIVSPPARVGFVTVRNRTLTPLAERFLIAPERSQTQSQFARYPSVCCHVHEGNTGLSAVISAIDQCGQGLGGSH